jgi:SNF2 family DNA or RNA helicase
MDTVTIDFFEDTELLILTGATDKLLRNRRAKHYLLDLSVAIENNVIQIPCNDRSLEQLIQRIRSILATFDIAERLSKNVEQKISYFLTEENDFKEFSKEAYSIREGIYDKENFETFSRCLNSSFPSRELYPIQLLSAYHLAFSQNACNFSVPGAGKTSVVYGAYAYLKSLPKDNQKHVDKLIIVGPLSSFGPWEAEYKACFGLQASSKRLSGGISFDEKKSYFYSTNPAEIILISYQGLPSIIDHLEKYLKKNKCMVVLDEAHKIKNTDGGVIASSALQMAKYCKARVILTGTPAPNGYEDLYNLYKFIWPTKSIISFQQNQLKDMSKKHHDLRVPKLVDEIKPYFMRIKKSHLKIPKPVNHAPIIVNMGDVQSEIYTFIEKSYMDFFQKTGKNSLSFQSSLAQARLIRMMQASTNPALLLKPLEEYYSEQGMLNNVFLDDTEIINKIVNYSSLEIPAKFVRAADLIESIITDETEKVIVWMMFIQNIKDFSEYLDTRGISSKAIWGETPVENDSLADDIETRESIISEFHMPDSSFKVLIANSFAIAESISLHKACHNAIYLERSFNAGNFVQSKDRIHRYGLEKKVNYYYILSNNNIDTTIHERLIFKETRMIEIMENEEIPLFQLLDDDSEDNDLRKLIENYVSRSF